MLLDWLCGEARIDKADGGDVDEATMLSDLYWCATSSCKDMAPNRDEVADDDEIKLEPGADEGMLLLAEVVRR